jgi:uncharacterized protein (TIGR02145 family)
MKNLALILLVLSFLTGCKKNNTDITTTPILTTTAISSTTQTTAVSGGSITSDGGTSITARGVCWSTNANPTTANSKTTDGTGTGSFSSSLIGLTASSMYYVKAYATNSAGTGYGNAVSFTTAPSTTCSQVWMTTNLDVTTYRNGDPIPQVTDPTQWAGLTTGAWCYNNNDPANGAIYGKLYNWYAVNDSRGLAPQGWHIPSDAEWTTLSTCLGGEIVAGGAMKEVGTTHWSTPNTGASNSSGFAGLPGGYRGYSGMFANVGGFGSWWSSTESGASAAWFRYLTYGVGDLGRDGDYETSGFSVRCLRD